ncbi:MACPF domain-containing protein [Quillaja saponaria]|uniref:MACPF domain-containing protein n=1 Tax=Quillaja saponaria TaxID=32244 RepID=A0AAD7KXN9_QUISA|nr:MACPF domain-containing protein [Quillaja saponaria]
MAISFTRLDPNSAAEKAVSAIGLGYDLCNDIRLSSCKLGPLESNPRLIELDSNQTRDLVFPGGIVIPNVPTSIKCDKGERTRFRSDVLSFSQMSEQFNQELSLSGKIPSGLFNAMFDMKTCWQKDASSTKSLTFDGWFITLYNVELARTHVTLSENVKREVPSLWDPSALAEFIDKYGTHIIVGVRMGGKDVVHIKQKRNSDLHPTEVQKLLKQLADKRFSEDPNRNFNLNPAEFSRKLKDDHVVHWDAHKVFAAAGRPSIRTHSKNDDIMSISVRRGGINIGQDYNQWLSTISQSPNVISMSFVPITSLLNGVQGSGFLTHAMNLYLRYKPPIEELQQFLEFQLPRQWAPVYGDLPLGLGLRRRRSISPSLQFTFMGPKLYVNTLRVDSANRPVTGARLYLEGKKSDHLAIHLQHLSTLPSTFQLSDDHSYEPIEEPVERGFYEPVKWSIFSHVCTAPVQYDGARIDDTAFIVTKAWLEVKVMGIKKVLFLRLGFSMVESARSRRSEWEGPSSSSRKSGFFSTLISARFSTELKPPEKPAKVDLNSAVYPNGPPVPTRAPKMQNFVDTNEKVRGPEDPPGYWVVTGAKLCVEGARISLKLKYSLLTIMSEESLILM